MSGPIVTLLTDFGLRDGYVGAVKGVILSRCPAARLVDLSHEIAPGDIGAAAYVLGQSASYFPPDTVHLAVVDPGVGSRRRGIACRVGPQRYVAPDNGILSRVLDCAEPCRAFEIARAEAWRESVSPVFHGRDVFAPVAAHLAAGGELGELGAEIEVDGLARAGWPEPRREADGRIGCVVYVDHFGNLVTNLTAVDVPPEGELRVAGRSIPRGRTYSDVHEGALVALVGSSGLIEIAKNGGSAAALLGAAPGHVVTWAARSRS